MLHPERTPACKRRTHHCFPHKRSLTNAAPASALVLPRRARRCQALRHALCANRSTATRSLRLAACAPRPQKPETNPSAFDKPATTVLSPYLKFGCLSARLFHSRLLEVRYCPSRL